MTTAQEFILAAQRDGYRVVEAPENPGWWQVHVPARPRYPANVQGDFNSSERAWMVAASLAKDVRNEAQADAVVRAYQADDHCAFDVPDPIATGDLPSGAAMGAFLKAGK